MSKGRNIMAIGLALALVTALAGGRAVGDHQPANKVSVSGSALEIMSADITTGTDSSVETLLVGSFKSSAPKDLIIQLTAECALWTDTKTVGDGDSEAVGTVTMWVEVDNKVVPVTSDADGDKVHDDPDDGKVVFCNRAFRQATTGFNDDGDEEDNDSQETIELFQRTRSANAFNWLKLNVGKGVHTIAVKAQLDVNVTGIGRAKAAVGKRTLVVEPTSMANDAVV